MRFVVCLLVLSLMPLAAENWPQWRGPDNNNISRETNLPVKWSPTENVAWKLPMPARSGSTPIIWGDLIFLNVAENGNLFLWCVDRNRPAVLWKKSVSGGDVMKRKQNMSSPSPVTDGKTVWVLTGTGALKAFNFDGQELWARDLQKDYGPFGLNHGYASSPLLYKDALYVQVLHGMLTDDPSYVLRIDPKTGKTLWRVERPTDAIRESPDSYATPAILKYKNQEELVINGGDCVTGHDLATGKELWRGRGFNPDNNPFNRIIASPVTFDGIVYAPTRIRPLQVFRAGGRGDITRSHLVFSFQNGPDVPTPVTDGKYFYSVNDKGIIWCLDAKTGAEVYAGARISTGTYSASPILAGGMIYITSEEGVTSVFKAGPKFELLAENNFNDYCLSTVAVSDGQLFIRTTGHLWCIGKRTK
ncbi:MAG: PQQ-binding-like beta-propeller repeat protein [Bryobacteraceae bacterium]